MLCLQFALKNTYRFSRPGRLYEVPVYDEVVIKGNTAVSLVYNYDLYDCYNADMFDTILTIIFYIFLVSDRY